MAEKRDLVSYNLGFRPKTYWPISTEVDKLIAQIKEPARRKAVQRALKNGEVPPKWLIDPTLSPTVRTYLGMSNRLTGGSFLPDLHPLEAEIAWVQIKSTNWDTFSLRAQLAPDGSIRYFLFDENGDFGSPYEMSEEDARDGETDNTADNAASFKIWSGEAHFEPMSMGEVFEWLANTGIEALDDAPILTGDLAWNLEGMLDLDEAESFVTVGSAFYPELADYCDQYLKEFIAERWTGKPREEEEEEEEDL